jgi:hypothetical protein
MRIERDDIPYISRGRVAQKTAKRSNQIVIVSVIVVAAAVLLANKLPPFLAYAMIIGGGGLLGWDVWNVSKQRKYTTKELLAEWRKEHAV